jgi:hypothetical protein
MFIPWVPWHERLSVHIGHSTKPLNNEMFSVDTLSVGPDYPLSIGESNIFDNERDGNYHEAFRYLAKLYANPN